MSYGIWVERWIVNILTKLSTYDGNFLIEPPNHVHMCIYAFLHIRHLFFFFFFFFELTFTLQLIGIRFDKTMTKSLYSSMLIWWHNLEKNNHYDNWRISQKWEFSKWHNTDKNPKSFNQTKTTNNPPWISTIGMARIGV